MAKRTTNFETLSNTKCIAGVPVFLRPHGTTRKFLMGLNPDAEASISEEPPSAKTTCAELGAEGNSVTGTGDCHI